MKTKTKKETKLRRRKKSRIKISTRWQKSIRRQKKIYKMLEKYGSNRRVQKWSYLVQNNSKLVQNGPKELKRSDMVQYCLNLSRKFFKLVQYNQVSWSSFQCRQNGNVNKTEISLNWNVTKTELSPKLKCHQNWNVTKT